LRRGEREAHSGLVAGAGLRGGGGKGVSALAGEESKGLLCCCQGCWEVLGKDLVGVISGEGCSGCR